jgi:hypothetical protein
VCGKRGMPPVLLNGVRQPWTSVISCRRETSVKIWGFKPSANMFVTLDWIWTQIRYGHGLDMDTDGYGLEWMGGLDM